MPLNVLIVIDGAFTFDAVATPGATPDFTLTTLVATLTAAGINVTKANRAADTTASPNFDSFHFDGLSINLLDYDTIWLIGDAGRNSVSQSSSDQGSQPLPDSELAAIARYMEAGGGLFAVGDHDSLGSVMSGQLPRVRAMRCWYGANDPFARCGHGDAPGSTGINWTGQGVVPANFPVFTTASVGRADTVQTSPMATYPNDFGGVPYVWFENQSDSRPQPITPSTSPAHPILRRNGHEVTIYPDHMHEGNTLGIVAGYDYTRSLSFNGAAFPEFPAINSLRELPSVVATGQSIAQASRHVPGTTLDSNLAGTSIVNSLSAYNGLNAGVGRIVTGSTFHHYIDINLTGASNVTGTSVALAGTDAQKHHGFNDVPANFDDITGVFLNITQWLARPARRLQLILERSTFSQDEATAGAIFNPAIFVTVDGLKPDQFPGGGITSLSPGAFQPAWAPQIASPIPGVIAIEPISVDSDDPTRPPRLQRFTFTYQVRFLDVAAAFSFAGAVEALAITATLTSPTALAAPLSDSADIELIKSANPFMLDLDNGNTTTWLSSDVRVFPVVAGDPKLGVTLPANATRADALVFLQTMLSSLSIADFVNLDHDEELSALSPFATTTGMPAKNVYNFALARVRLGTHLAPADNVRVFFRIVPAPTTAALTYQEVAGAPVGSYRQTSGGNPVAEPGVDNTGMTWLSFPCFARSRMTPDSQPDSNNIKMMPANPGGEVSYFYGALIDNNLDDAYLPPSPLSAAAPVSLPTLLMGEHQCLVAQVSYNGAPIPNGANPATSDKMSQRNLAFSPIANPGLNASRMALHTFEIEATPYAGLLSRPDELLFEWVHAPPAGTSVSLFLPTWNAQDVVDLADRLYARHDIAIVDAHTLSLPGGGTRYIPIPRCDGRQTGVITANFPLGVVKGQRFDLSVRQVTSRNRPIKDVVPKVERISQQEATALIKRLGGDQAAKGKSSQAPKGIFDLGHNKTLITDLAAVDDHGDHALVVEQIDPARLAAAHKGAGAWRETIGAFQLAVPVSVKADMLPHHLRLLSVFRWRAEHLPQRGRWNDAFLRYLDLITDKVRALGGDPYAVPATPDGAWPGLWGTATGSLAGGTHGGHPPHPVHGCGVPAAATGKIGGLHYDGFGDFEGFTLHTASGAHHRFLSREPRVERLAREAWLERYWVSVHVSDADPAWIRELVLDRPT